MLVFSVGGGSREHNVSTNLVGAMEAAREAGASIYGVVGAPGGTLAELADVAILIEPPARLRTPLVESFQAVVWHALVSHPELAVKQGHWESLAAAASRERALVAARTGDGPLAFELERRHGGSGGRRAAVFLDRDGTLNEAVPDPDSGDRVAAAAWRTCGWSREPPRRCRRLARAGYAAGVRLQPAGGGEGQRSPSPQLLAVHERVLELLAREGVRRDRRLAAVPAPPRRRWSASCRGRATAASPRRACCSTRPATLGLDLGSLVDVGRHRRGCRAPAAPPDAAPP